jgi:hypothetical protein
MDDVRPVTSGQAGHGLQRLDAHQKQRQEYDIEPYCAEHQRPKRGLLFGRLHAGGEAEMAGDHRERLSGAGHGNPASTRPTMMTKKMTPRINCIC